MTGGRGLLRKGIGRVVEAVMLRSLVSSVNILESTTILLVVCFVILSSVVVVLCNKMSNLENQIKKENGNER